jgi:hypothetical protein
MDSGWKDLNSVPWRSAVFKRRKILLVMWSITGLLAARVMLGPAIAAQSTAIPKTQDNVAMGEAEIKQLLPLMGQDKNGKVSKRDFMRFMEEEFDRLDKKKEGKLDVKELTQPQVPVRGFHK